MTKPSVRLVSTDHVADMTGYAPSTIRQFARQGRIPARRVGQRSRFVIDEIEQWMTDLPKAAS